MATILFEEIVFGPVHSRRLGVSLGINLLPIDGKLCSFNCIYCECGLNEHHRTRTSLPSRAEVAQALEQKLCGMQAAGMAPDVITFAGNGEPTLHPDFAGIVADTIGARNRFFPAAKIAVLSNATTLDKEAVFEALNQVDEAILKLDSVSDDRIRQVDCPNIPSFTYAKLLAGLKRFNGNLIIQTMFLKGVHNGKSVDNTTEAEIVGWLQALRDIHPKQVMIYTIDRETPVKNLRKAAADELETIASRARKAGFEVTVSV